MKSRVTVLVLSAMLLGGAFLSQAMPGPGDRPRPGCDGPSQREPFPAGLARILELSEVQKGKIQAILDEEWDQGQAQREKESALHEQLHKVERAATFNEQAVGSAAAALAGLETERIVARARTHFRIGTVLTAAQRSLAERLRAEMDDRPAPPCAEMQGHRRHGPDDGPRWR